jgi:hypothetical protein
MGSPAPSTTESAGDFLFAPQTPSRVWRTTKRWRSPARMVAVAAASDGLQRQHKVSKPDCSAAAWSSNRPEKCATRVCSVRRHRSARYMRRTPRSAAVRSPCTQPHASDGRVNRYYDRHVPFGARAISWVEGYCAMHGRAAIRRGAVAKVRRSRTVAGGSPSRGPTGPDPRTGDHCGCRS